MEERPRQTEQDPPEDESDKINPGEIFLKKSINTPEQAEASPTEKYQDGSRFRGWFGDTLIDKTPPETVAERPNEETTGEKPSVHEAAEELRFDNHEGQSSTPGKASSAATTGHTTQDISQEATDAHHISDVISQRAQSLREDRQSRSPKSAWGKSTKAQSTTKPYVKAASYGFAIALLLLFIIIITAIL